MNRTDPDLAAIRALATDVAGGAADPSAEAVARTWARVAAGRRRRPWFVVPATAAAVLAVAVGAAVVLRPAPAAEFGAAPPPSAPSPPAPSASAPAPDLGTTVRQVPLDTVVAAMAARAASVPPLAVPAGKLLYVRTDAVGSTADATSRHEMWLDPQGMVARRIVRDGTDMGAGEPQPGGSLRNPSPESLAALPTNPRTLLSRFRALNSDRSDWPHLVLKELSELYTRCDPVLPAALRAGLYRMLGEVPDLSAYEVRLGGRMLYEVRRQKDYGVDDLLLDPATGRVVGGRTIWFGPPENGIATGQVTGVWLVHHAVVDTVRDTG